MAIIALYVEKGETPYRKFILDNLFQLQFGFQKKGFNLIFLPALWLLIAFFLVLTGMRTWPFRYRPLESMLGLTYTAPFPDPESTSPPQPESRMKINAMIQLRCFILLVSVLDGYV